MTEAILTPQSLSLIPRNGLYLPFHGGTKTHLGVSPSTESGGIIYPPYLDKTAIQVAEATTNLVCNPSAEIDLTYITKGGVLDIVERITSDSRIGNACIHCYESDSISSNEYVYFGGDISGNYMGPITGGANYSLSISAKKVGYPETRRGQAYIWWYDETGIIGSSTERIDFDEGSHEWKEFSIGPIVAHVDAIKCRIVVTMGLSTGTSGHLYLDGAQLEAKDYPTPYADGSLGTGHSWSGTEHASTSSRTKTSLVYDLTLPTKWTIGFCYIPTMLESESDSYHRVFVWAGDSTNYVGVYTRPTQDQAYFIWEAQDTINTLSYLANQWERFVPIYYTITYDGINIKIYQDGTILSGETEAPTQPTFSTIPDTLYLGSSEALGSHANGWQNEFLVLDYDLTASEVGALWG